MFEGAPDFPMPDRWAGIIEKHKVTIFYTAPTAIRMFEKLNGNVGDKYQFNSLRLLGSVGEPIDESAWSWYYKNVGKERCPIVDTWWQTETGGILITSLPGLGPFKPSFAGLPFPGIKVDILDDKGETPLVFAVSKSQRVPHDLKKEIIEQIKKEIGPIALPKEIYIVEDLPKTRSGKIMRRILRKLFTLQGGQVGEELGDLSTLANPESVEHIKIKIAKPNDESGFTIFFLDFLFVVGGVFLLILGITKDMEIFASVIDSLKSFSQ